MNLFRLVHPKISAELVKMMDEGLISRQTARELLHHYVSVYLKLLEKHAEEMSK